jgi:hypothetical protein
MPSQDHPAGINFMINHKIFFVRHDFLILNRLMIRPVQVWSSPISLVFFNRNVRINPILYYLGAELNQGNHLRLNLTKGNDGL